MKQFKKLAVAIVLFVGATTFVNAQSKIAHIDVQKVLSEMPEMKAAQAELKKLEETYKADLQSSVAELRNKYNQYKNEAPNKTKEENDKRALELQNFEKNIAEAEQSAAQEIQKKQMELYQPILDKLRNAIKKVARAQGYQYVMDASGLIVADGKDLEADVKKELGF